MAEPRLCPACAAWMTGADDAWCARCGAPCAQLAVEISSPVLRTGQLAPKLFVRVTNASCAELPVTGIELPPWMALTPPVFTRLRPGQTATAEARARTLGLTRPEGAAVSVTTPAGGASTLLLVLDEKPALTCDPPVVELWESPERRNHVLRVSPAAGVMRIREVRPGPGLTVVSEMKEPVLAAPGSGVAVVVAASVERFRTQAASTLVVRYDGPHDVASAEVGFRIAVRNPPRLRWEGEHQPPEERLRTAGQTMKFVLWNQADARDAGTGNATLAIETATLTPPIECPEATPRLLSRLPADLPGGQAVTLEFELGLENVRARREPVHFTLSVRTNGPALDKPVPLFIREMPEFDGVLAIDFGSSNTCCAVVETGREYERLPLDGERVVAPTVLRYLDLSGAVPVIETGARVKNLAARSDEAAAGTVDKLKQRLGEARQEIPVRPRGAAVWTTRTATEAATDYLRHLRRVAEAGRGAVFREFILTHPAVCSLRQFRNLATALEQAFGGHTGQVHFLQEPIAALIPFLAEQTGEGYTVASFDLGGGTTDLALVRVEHRVQPTGRVDIHPTILHCRGLRFGGEDLTDFLEARLSENSEHLLARQKPGAKLIARGLAAASTEDMLRNRFALREAAEQFKASLSEQGAAPEPGSIILRVQPAPGEPAQDFNAAFSELRRAGDADMQPQFLAFAATRVGEVARLLRAAADVHGPIDVIHLSGLTTLLPIVGQVLGGLFPGVRVERARNPKECVVTGACLSRSLSHGTQRRLVLPPGGTQRTTSSIGLFDPVTETFTAILPTDTAIPPEGLEGELAAAWFGSEPVPLFENLGASAEELRTPAGSRMLHKLGTWRAERIVAEAFDAPWALRLRLRHFALEVSAWGPEGEPVAFRPIPEEEAAYKKEAAAYPKEIAAHGKEAAA